MPEQLSIFDLSASQKAESKTPALLPQFTHHCHAIGCNKPVPPKMLMCKRHWAMVPPPLRQEVWRHYRPGQEVDKNPSPEYLAAAKAAIAAVCKAESDTLPKTAKFAAGDVVLIDGLTWAGQVIGPAEVDGMLLINIGVPGNPYCCSECRVSKYTGVVSLWRLGQATVCDRLDCHPEQHAKLFTCPQCDRRSEPHWWYVGHMADGPRSPKWPDAVWFPAGYDPNRRSFE